jgi:hypothetical protein
MVTDRSPLHLDKEVSHAAWLAVCQLKRIMRCAKVHRMGWSLKPEKWFGAGLVRKRIFMLAVIKRAS